jgi:hypothetical protein
MLPRFRKHGVVCPRRDEALPAPLEARRPKVFEPRGRRVPLYMCLLRERDGHSVLGGYRTRAAGVTFAPEEDVHDRGIGAENGDGEGSDDCDNDVGDGVHEACQTGGDGGPVEQNAWKSAREKWPCRLCRGYT